VDHAENGRGRSDTERQSENGESAEAGVSRKDPEPVAQVLRESADG
jgi:hypothetical protein